MSKQNYSNENRDLAQLATSAKFWFQENGYDTQLADSGPQGPWLIQARKTSGMRTFLGTNQAFTIKIEGNPQEYSVEVSIGKWVDNLAGAGMSGLFTGGLTWVTAGLGAAWGKKLENDFWEWLKEKKAFGGTAASAPVATSPPSLGGSWYYTTDGKSRTGPISFEQLKATALKGTHMVWQEGTPNWIPASQVPGLIAVAPSPPVPAVAPPPMPSPPPMPGIAQKASPPPPKPAAPSVNFADQIKKLAELRDAGILTPEEFEAKKKDILSRM